MIACYGPEEGTGIGRAFHANVRALAVFNDVSVNVVGGSKVDTVFVQYPIKRAKAVLEMLEGQGVWAKRRIFYFVWESSEIDEETEKVLAGFTEIWTASQFCRVVLAKAGFESKYVPHCTELFSFAQERQKDKEFRFITFFDGGSRVFRKNPFGAIEAFKRAGLKNARLLVKFKNCASGLVGLLEKASRGLKVDLIDKSMTGGELNNLLASCDGLISLHRGEGFGLTVLEAMACGMPVVVTDWSGTRDFVNVRSGFPVKCRLRTSFDSYYAGLWADPDLDDAAKQIRAAAKVSFQIRKTAFDTALDFDMSNLIAKVGGALCN